MPAFDEEASIEAAIDEVRECVLDRVAGARLIVIDDGSRDATGAILDRIGTDPGIRVVHQANAGHGPALRAGLDHADAEWILLVDSDRQIPMTAFDALWASRTGVDAVFGRRTNREDTAVRRIVTGVLRLLLTVLFAVPLADSNAPFKLLRRDLWTDAARAIPPGCTIPSVLIAAYVVRTGRPHAIVPVEHRRRSAGQTSLRSLKLFRFSARAAGELIAFRLRP
jgi:glycosyltransferase involved in cell wall biosynthesis